MTACTAVYGSNDFFHPVSQRDSRSDSELLEAMAQGEQAALGELYARHAEAMLSMASTILRNLGDSEDVLHEVFLEAWVHASEFDPTRGTVRAWLLIRLRSRAFDRRRAIQRSVLVFGVPLTERPTTLLSEPDRTTLRRAVARLAEHQRIVLQLAYFHDLSLSEIATTIDIPIGTAKSRLARGLKALREHLLPDVR